ncbi:hypothetical protein [Microvirga lotononidis]|uniref:Uncharacterized protein n=1 Tax=Microvirga lotononidis TaxID=864069 RepID=I4YNZ9_9HYPH|nr:hypothetical protein [Microvirga lotononidis]EIM25691.1 hypothetical protein MicloDRAFT_00064180 [Microvirga lotononidis]WQO25629.1 hypothetical protein U0023_12970 [Microvirga lotononidis]
MTHTTQVETGLLIRMMVALLALKEENNRFREALIEIRSDPYADIWELIFTADMALKDGLRRPQKKRYLP